MSRLGARPSRADLLLAGAVAAAVVAASIAVEGHGLARAGPSVRHLDPVGVAVLVVTSGVLAWRRRHPTTVLLVVFGCVTGYDMLHYPTGPAWLPLIIAFCTAIARGERRIAYAVGLAGYLLSVQPLVGRTSLGTQVGLAAWLLVLAAVGEITRIRTRARRAEAQHTADAAAARTEQARRRASEQRLRVAQDLHDVLAHQLALITVQANVALALQHRDPDHTTAALRAIKDAGNTALGELQTVLDTLRTADGEAPPRHPTPLLSCAADLDRLLHGTQTAGLTVRHQSHGRPRHLALIVDQSAYRIVQEGLTNAVRHAGPGTTVSVSITYTDQALRISIDDDGGGQPPQVSTGGGNGLAGMRERISALGGTLHAGPSTGHGFRIEATLPTEEPR